MNHAEHDESIGSMLASIAAALREVSDKLDVVAARVQQEVPAFPADEDLPDQTRIRRLESWAFHASQDISRLSSRLDALDGGDGDQPPPPTPRGTRSRREVREAAERAAAERGEPDTDDAAQRPPLERRHSRTDHLGDPTWPLTVAPVPRAAEDRAASTEWTAPEEVRATPEAPAAQEPARASDDGSTRAALAELIAALQADAGVQVTLPPDSSPGGGLSPEGPGGGGGARTVNGARREDAPSPGHRGGVASSAAEVPPRNGYPAADTSGRAPQASLNGAGSATASSTDAPSRNGRRSATASSPVEAASRNGARAASTLSADTNATASTGIRVLDETRPSESQPEIAPRNGSGTTVSRPTSDSGEDALPPRSATATPRNGARPIPTRSLSEPVGTRALDTDPQTRNGSRHGANPALDSVPGARSETDRAQQAHGRDLDSTRAGGQVSEPGRALDREQSAGGSRSAEARTAEGAQQPADGPTSTAGSASAAAVGGHGAPERDAGFTSSADAGVADPFSEEKTEVGMRPVGVERARPVSRHGDDVTVPGVVARHGVPEVRTGSDREEPAAGDPRSAGLTAGHREESPVNGRAVNGFDARAVADHGIAVSGSTANGIQWTFTDEDPTTPSAPSPALTNPATPASSPSEPRSALTSPAAGPGEPGTPTAPAHVGAHNASIELPTRGSSADPSSPTPSGLPTRSPARLSAHRTTMDAADLAGLTNPSVTPGPGGEARPTALTNPSASPASGGETRPTGLTNPGAPVSSGNAADLGGSSASTAPGPAHFDSSGDTGAAGAPSVRPTVEPAERPDSPAYTGDAAVADKADFDAFTNTGAPEATTGRVTAQRADGLTHAGTPTMLGAADFDHRAATSAAPGHQAPFDAAADLPSTGGRVGSANSTPLTGSTSFTTPAPAGSAPERFDTGNYSGTTEFTGTSNGATAPDSPATSPLRRITSDPAPPTETDAAGITVTGTFRAFDREERAHGDKLQAMLDELKRSAGLQRRDVFGPPPTDAG